MIFSLKPDALLGGAGRGRCRRANIYRSQPMHHYGKHEPYETPASRNVSVASLSRDGITYFQEDIFSSNILFGDNEELAGPKEYMIEYLLDPMCVSGRARIGIGSTSRAQLLPFHTPTLSHNVPSQEHLRAIGGFINYVPNVRNYVLIMFIQHF